MAQDVYGEIDDETAMRTVFSDIRNDVVRADSRARTVTPP